jgi:hypothetical protein
MKNNDPCENCDMVLNCKDCGIFRKLHNNFINEQKAKNNPNLCCVCHKNYVDSTNGYDTCQSCLNNI